MSFDSDQAVFVVRVEHRQPSKVQIQRKELTGLESTVAQDKSLLGPNHSDWYFHLHDLRSGIQISFSSWHELQDYIKKQTKKALQ